MKFKEQFEKENPDAHLEKDKDFYADRYTEWLENKWRPENGDKLHTSYPSRYAIGEKVTLDFLESGKIKNCVIADVRFTESNVHYSVFIPISAKTEEATIVENISSIYVTDFE